MLFRAFGALLFVVALAGAGYVLLRVWPAAPAMATADIGRALLDNAALYTLFAAHHSLLARAAVKRWLSRWIPEPLHRTVYVAAASLLLLLVMFGWRPVGHVVYTVTGWGRTLLQLAQAIGGVLIVLAARVIDPFELAGLRPPIRARLEIRGAYRLVRHPIYLGFLLVVWTPATMTGDRLWFALLSTLYLALAIPWEERGLLQALGAPYAAYRARVRWRVIPGLF